VKIPVAGKSMEPFLQNRDLVVLKRFEENDLVNGKIVLAYFNNAYVLPVVRIKKTVTLAGDGNIQQVEIITIRYTGSCNPCIPRGEKIKY
jgi:signal peptidase I